MSGGSPERFRCHQEGLQKPLSTFPSWTQQKLGVSSTFSPKQYKVFIGRLVTNPLPAMNYCVLAWPQLPSTSVSNCSLLMSPTIYLSLLPLPFPCWVPGRWRERPHAREPLDPQLPLLHPPGRCVDSPRQLPRTCQQPIQLLLFHFWPKFAIVCLGVYTTRIPVYQFLCIKFRRGCGQIFCYVCNRYLLSNLKEPLPQLLTCNFFKKCCAATAYLHIYDLNFFLQSTTSSPQLWKRLLCNCIMQINCSTVRNFSNKCCTSSIKCARTKSFGT